MKNAPTIESKKITLNWILSWILGIFFGFIGFISVFSEPIPWIILLTMAAVLLPNVNKLVLKKWWIHISGKIKLLTVLIGLVLFSVTIDTSNIPNSPQVEIQKTEELKTETNEETNTGLNINTPVKTQPEKQELPVSADTNKVPPPIKTEDKPVPTEAPKSIETVSQKNAVAKAKSYLGYSAFSHGGLVAQLEYEQFSHSDAVYGADNSGANWNEQAAKKAKSYLEYSAFSRGSLIQQLKFEKFTQAQAEYWANAVGL